MAAEADGRGGDLHHRAQDEGRAEGHGSEQCPFKSGKEKRSQAGQPPVGRRQRGDDDAAEKDSLRYVRPAMKSSYA